MWFRYYMAKWISVVCIQKADYVTRLAVGRLSLPERHAAGNGSICGADFCSKTNQMHNISNLFYFWTTLYMFRTVFPSVIRSLRLYIQHQVLWLLASGNEMISFTLAVSTEPAWHTPDSVCTVLDSWWWTERLSETCRVLFQNKINLRYCASGWFYYRNILRCTVLQTSNVM
jgi:hypothetical protein